MYLINTYTYGNLNVGEICLKIFVYTPRFLYVSSSLSHSRNFQRKRFYHRLIVPLSSLRDIFYTIFTSIILSLLAIDD